MMHRNGGTSSWLNISRKQHTTNKQHRNKRRVHIPHTISIMVSTFIDTCKTVYKVYVLCLYIINTQFNYYYARMRRCGSFLPFESSFILKMHTLLCCSLIDLMHFVWFLCLLATCIYCYIWHFLYWHIIFTDIDDICWQNVCVNGNARVITK